MIEEFIDELTATLESLGVTDKEKYAREYSVRFENLRASGKSEFESLMALGDPVADAYAIAGKDCPADLRLSDFMNKRETDLPPQTEETDDSANSNGNSEKRETKPRTAGEKAFYWIFAVIALCLEIAMYFITAVTGIVSVAYAIAAWASFAPETTWKVFALAVTGFATFIIFAAISTVLLKKIILFLKNLNKNIIIEA